MAPARLLLVDDDESIRSGLQSVLEAYEFEVTTASNVNEALQCIVGGTFEVLLSDLHMPHAGDGLTVVSAMRHANPKAVTMVLSANPDMGKAVGAILKQADDIVLKPVNVSAIVDRIYQLLALEPQARRRDPAEEIATILEREIHSIIEAWLDQMQAAGSRTSSTLSLQERSEHLPDALRDVSFRLRYPQPLGSTPVFSMSALQHGARRRRQGIGPVTLVEEARAFQVALFRAVGKNLRKVDPSLVPGALMTIADEINAQLLQGLEGYENENPEEAGWSF